MAPSYLCKFEIEEGAAKRVLGGHFPRYKTVKANLRRSFSPAHLGTI